MRTALLLLATAGTLVAAEPSAFGAGDLDNPNPYGLTKNEKQLLETKKRLDAVKQKSQNTETRVSSLRERLDGLQSIVEGVGETSHKNLVEIDTLKKRYSRDQDADAKALAELEARVTSNEENVLKLKGLLEEFSKTLDTVNGNYVTKGEYNRLVKDINTFKQLVSKELKTRAAAPAQSSGSDDLEKMSGAEVAKEAKALYEKKMYTKAIAYYEHLIAKNYRPARAHYMIGEMWYKRNDYGQAIAYFKKSAQLYDKADYMPTLMLHTALSMEATQDTANAKKFFGGVVAQYPETEEAATAAAHLQKLK